MMTDIRNQKVFASYLQRADVQFDLLSILEELEQQVCSCFPCQFSPLGSL